MNSSKDVILSNASATGSGVSFRGGKAIFMVEATGTGTNKLQIQSPNSTWIDVPNASFTTTTGFISLDLPPGQYRVNVATFTAVSAWLFGIQI